MRAVAGGVHGPRVGSKAERAEHLPRPLHRPFEGDLEVGALRGREGRSAAAHRSLPFGTDRPSHGSVAPRSGSSPHSPLKSYLPHHPRAVPPAIRLRPCRPRASQRSPAGLLSAPRSRPPPAISN